MDFERTRILSLTTRSCSFTLTSFSFYTPLFHFFPNESTWLKHDYTAALETHFIERTYRNMQLVVLGSIIEIMSTELATSSRQKERVAYHSTSRPCVLHGSYDYIDHVIVVWGWTMMLTHVDIVVPRRSWNRSGRHRGWNRCEVSQHRRHKGGSLLLRVLQL